MAVTGGVNGVDEDSHSSKVWWSWQWEYDDIFN